MSFVYPSLKESSLQICEQLSRIPSESFRAVRQKRCASFLNYAIDPDTWHMNLNWANFCHQRTCPICNYICSCKWRMRLFNGFPRLLDDYPGYGFLFLTLTQKNCHLFEMRSTIREMQKSWHRLAGRAKFPALGYFRTLEVTRPYECFYAGQYLGCLGTKLIKLWQKELISREVWDFRLWKQFPSELVHPHFHILMMVSPNYWRSGYLDHKDWVSNWRMAARLDYQPWVHIQAVKDEEIKDSVFEISKYCVKVSDMSDRLGVMLMRRLHGFKLLTVGGVFSNYFDQKTLDQIAETGEIGTEERQAGVPLVYEWNDDFSKYDLARIGFINFKANSSDVDCDEV
jgi:plasmid rolling circle replication initiator protein Rep